jgi:hypothetical protein
MQRADRSWPAERSQGASRPSVAAALLALAVLLTASFAAANTAEIQRGAQGIAAERTRLQQQRRLDVAAEQRLIESLGQLALRFIDLSDRAAQRGDDSTSTLRPAFEALYGPLDGVYQSYNGRLERMARQIMDVDGDLEALYETKEWKESQLLAAQSLYYLNWLNYYGARLYDGQRRKELLEAAERGFSEFAVGERQTELLSESLLGRALCHLELGHYEWAVRDFQIVIDEPAVSAERKAKARLGLLDAYVRAGKFREALQYSEQLLRSGALPREDGAIVRFYRLQVLFDLAGRSASAESDRYRREAANLMDQLRRVGPGWAQRVEALMAASIEDPAQWAGKTDTPEGKWELIKLMVQKNDYAAAAPLLEETLADERPAAQKRHYEASYLLGVAEFRSGNHRRAADLLTSALAGGSADVAAEAYYLRFKALEAPMAEEPTPELTEQYAAALRAFLEKSPDHPNAYEAHYRLGELLHAQREFQAAIDEYRKVSGDPAFELRARFGALQSEFELLREAQSIPEREQIVTTIGEDLASFWKQVANLDRAKYPDLPLEEFEAKATLFQAVHGSLASRRDGDEEITRLLADFAERYPNQRDILPQAVRLRLRSLQRLGRFSEAVSEVQKHQSVLIEDGRVDSVEQLATGFMKAAARRKSKGELAAAKDAEQAALLLYEALASDGQPPGKTKLTLARLYEATGEIDKAERLYSEVLEGDGVSLAALRGLAQIAEARQIPGQALAYWKRYTEATTPGDPPWYEGHYEQARLTLARGNADESCGILKQLRPAMAGLGNPELRAKLSALYDKACK